MIRCNMHGNFHKPPTYPSTKAAGACHLPCSRQKPGLCPPKTWILFVPQGAAYCHCNGFHSLVQVDTLCCPYCDQGLWYVCGTVEASPSASVPPKPPTNEKRVFQVWFASIFAIHLMIHKCSSCILHHVEVGAPAVTGRCCAVEDAGYLVGPVKYNHVYSCSVKSIMMVCNPLCTYVYPAHHHQPACNIHMVCWRMTSGALLT